MTPPAEALSMVTMLDTSALLRRYLGDRERPMVVDAMSVDAPWAASSLARTELQLALHLAAPNARVQREMWAAVRDD